MDELIGQFVIEGRELVLQASDELMALDGGPDDARRLDGAFRAIHTLKGSVAIFDMVPMGRALHAAEDLLEAARRGGTVLSRRHVAVLLDAVGRCDEWVEAVAATGTLPAAAGAESARLVAALKDEEVAAASAWNPAEAGGEVLAAGVTAFRYVPAPDCFFLGDDPLALVRTVPDLVALRILAEPPPAGELLDPFRCRLVIEGASAAAPAAIRAAFRFVADQVAYATARAVDAPAADVAPAGSRGEPGGMLRVAAGHVDALVGGIAELMVAGNALDHELRRLGDADPALRHSLADAVATVRRQAADVHHQALRLRLVPLRQTVRRLPRLVRETAATLGKEVALALRGEAVEVDKAIADALFEPLLHLVRNAIDHGIEPPDARAGRGKPPSGTIRIDAERLVDKVAITVADDGRGIDVDRVRERAVARGLIDPDVVPDRAAVLDLLFAPGFSTAERVTNVSGRGVGLDAVRAGIVALGGSVTLDSVPGRGSAFRLVLPQRAAVVPVLVVRAGGQRWGVPSDLVAEVLQLPPRAVVPLHHGEAFVHRGRTVPVLRLARLLGSDGDGGRAGPQRRILVARLDGDAVGIEVDDVEGRQDLLLRPAEGLLATTPGLGGAAVLGDGEVLMVLDLSELVAWA